MNKNRMLLLFIFLFNIFSLTAMEEHQKRGKKRPSSSPVPAIDSTKKVRKSYCPCGNTATTTATGLLYHLDKYHFNREEQAIKCPVDTCKKYFKIANRDLINHLSDDEKLFIVCKDDELMPYLEPIIKVDVIRNQGKNALSKILAAIDACEVKLNAREQEEVTQVKLIPHNNDSSDSIEEKKQIENEKLIVMMQPPTKISYNDIFLPTKNEDDERAEVNPYSVYEDDQDNLEDLIDF